MMKKLLRKLYFKLIGKPQAASSKAYIDYLKQKGIHVGNNVIVSDPTDILIDVSRPELIKIGDNVLLHKGTVIMAHDYASRAFVNKFDDFIPSHGRINIGNNVWLGQKVTILKNVTIGNNVIIGYGSVVTHSIPSNSIAVGSPAKVICTFTDYYEKRKTQYVEEAIDYALAIYESGRTPQVEDFYDDYPTFVDGHNWQEYDYPYSRIFTPEQFEQWKTVHHAPFDGFDEFMREVERRRKK